MTVADSRQSQRERQFHSARDFETSASQIGDIEPLSETLRRKAQLVVCGNAKGRSAKARLEDAEEMLRMLGLHPDQPVDDLKVGVGQDFRAQGAHR